MLSFSPKDHRPVTQWQQGSKDSQYTAKIGTHISLSGLTRRERVA